MELNFGSWLKHKWNAFLDRNPYSYRADVGPGYTYLFRRTCAAFLPVVSGTVGKGLGKAARLYLSATSNRINIFSPHFIESDAVHIPDPSYAHKFYTPMQSSG